MRHPLKAALLISSALIATPSLAQSVLSAPPPTQYIVDERGVDVLAGTFNLSTTDVVIGPPDQGGMVYSRSFAGTGWRDNLMSAVERIGTTSTYVVSIGGYSESFTKSGSTYTPAIPRGSKLVDTSSLILTWTWADGTVVVFDKNLSTGFSPWGGNFGRAISITRPNGERTDLTYETAVIEETIPLQRAVRLLSAQNNHGYRLVIQYEMMSGPTTSEQFGAWTRITGVSGRNIKDDYCDPEFCYSVAGPRPQATYVTGDSYSTVTDALGQATRYEYYTTDRRMTGIRLPGSTTNDISIAYTSNRVSSVQAGSSSWTYAYSDAAGVRTTTITDPASGVSTARSNISAQLLNSFTDPLTHTVNYAYNSGRVSQITLPRGNSVTYAYDGRGNITQTTWTPVAGSGLSNISTSASFAATCTNPITCNLPTTTTDERGGVTNYTWDASHGGLTAVKAPAPTSGAVRPETRITYGARSAWIKTGPSTFGPMATAITVPLTQSECVTAASCAGTAGEVRTTFNYGATASGNNVLATTVSTGSGDGVLTASTGMVYSSNGDLASINGPLPGTTDAVHLRYDLEHQLLGVVGPDPDGSGPLKRRAQRNTYDGRGQLTLQEQGTVDGLTDANWAAFASLQQATVAYDTLGRPIRTAIQAGGTTYGVSQRSYDVLGRLDCVVTRMNPTTFGSPPTSACTPATAGAFGPDRIVRYGYDAASRLTSTTNGYAVSPIGESLTRDANGNPVTMTDGKGNVSTLVHDGFDRMARLRYPNASGGGSSTSDYEDYGYDTTSNVVSFRDRAGIVSTITYDALNRDTALDLPGTASDVTVSYDLLDRLTGMTGGGQTLTYAWDALGRQTSESGPLGTVSSQYDLADRRTRLIWPDGLYVGYDYDLYDALTAVRENGTASGAGVLATYAYDNLGRRTSAVFGNGASSAFGWDAMSRLTNLSHNLAGTSADVSIALGYNPAGQLVSRTLSNTAYAHTPGAGTTSYANNGLNQVTAVSGAAVTYDGRQNTTGAPDATYTYDSLSRLSAATRSGATTSYSSDPEGRLYQSSGAVSARFLYDGWQLIGEYPSSGSTITRRHVPGLGLDDPIASYEGAGVADRRWLMADDLGSVMAVANGAGAAATINTYDEYGVSGSANAGRFQYAGQAWLPEAGVYALRARAYVPGLGRFLQPDPIGYSGGANLYTYVGADPVNWTDPLGLSRIDVGGRPYFVCAINDTPEVGTWAGGISSCSEGRTTGRPGGTNTSGTGFIPNTGSPGGGIGGAFPGAGFSGPPIQSDPQYAPFQAAYQAASERNEIYAEPILLFIPAAPAIKVFRGAGLLSRLAARVGRGCNCFVAGTEVQTSDGLKLIEQIAVGDQVLARDELTGETVFNRSWL